MNITVRDRIVLLREQLERGVVWALEWNRRRAKRRIEKTCLTPANAFDLFQAEQYRRNPALAALVRDPNDKKALDALVTETLYLARYPEGKGAIATVFWVFRGYSGAQRLRRWIAHRIAHTPYAKRVLERMQVKLTEKAVRYARADFGSAGGNDPIVAGQWGVYTGEKEHD